MTARIWLRTALVSSVLAARPLSRIAGYHGFNRLNIEFGPDYRAGVS